MLENLKKIYYQETPAERRQRMIPAAVYGALVATAYALTLSFVNVYTFPDLPLGMDWTRVLGMWIGLALAFAFFGAVAAWFTEEYAGIVGGALIFTAILAIWYLFTSSDQNSTAQSIITILPLAGVNMLAAWALRWAARRHLAIQHETQPGLRRKQMTRHVLTILLIGMIPGILGRMDTPAENTIRQMHELLQTAPKDPSVLPRLPLKQVPALEDHLGVEYRLYSRPSALAVSVLDVTVRFVDGFTMTCQLPISNGASFITQCNEGDAVKIAP